MERRCKHKEKMMLANMIFPLMFGAIFYYLLSPDVIFVKRMDQFLGMGIHIGNIDLNCAFIRLLRNYLPDMLWGYALVFALYKIIGNKEAGVWKAFVTAFLFSTVMECLQLTTFVRGTFDVFDIVGELLSEVAAVFIIKNFFEEEKNEKQI